MSATATQIHDYEPGIQDNGVFWTVPVDASSISFDVDTGAASYRLTDFHLNDYTSFPKSLSGAVTAPAVVSFDLQMKPSTKQRRYEQVDAANTFRGTYVEGGDSSIAWSSKQDGFTFASDAANTSTNLFSILGHERNGVFFKSVSATTPTTTAPPTASASGRIPATGGHGNLGWLGLGALAGSIIARRAVASRHEARR